MAEDDDQTTRGLSRRGFGALSAAAGLAAAAPSWAAGALPVTETDVSVKTPEGASDAAFIHPATGSYPGVLLWTDALGLRPAMRDIARRLAAEGYAVLVPNPFYRSARAPVFDKPFSFQNPGDMAKLKTLMGAITPAGAVQDATAFVGWLDTQPAVKKASKLGTFGYCMGGPLTMRTAAALPDRIGAAASFHGGGLVTDGPDSPHLLVPRIEAHYYFGVAASDDEKQPDAKDTLKAAFAASKVPAEIEVYAGTLHGWCVPDMPTQGGKPIYDKPEAERAWGHLTSLFKATLA